MAVQSCSRCLAPLPIQGEAAVVRCPFCGADNRVAPPPAPPAAQLTETLPAPNVAPEAGGWSPSGWAILAITIAFAGAIVVCTSLAAGEPFPSLQIKRSLSHLRETPDEDEGWFRVAAPDPPGGFAAFDPAAAIPWALALGQAWAPDAVLTTVHAELVRRDGTADVVSSAPDEGSSPPGVAYFFVSPARVADYHRRAEHQEVRVNYELYLRVAEGKVQAIRSLAVPGANTVPASALPHQVCPLVLAIAALEKQGTLPARPAYDAWLQASSPDRWALATRDSHVTAYARVDTCEPR